MQAEPLIHWPEPIVEYVGFVAQFLALGAVGFRYAALRDRLSAAGVHADAARRAARIGLIGLAVHTVLFVIGLPEAAARAHTTASALLATNPPTAAQAVLLAIGLIGLALASAGRPAGWPAALVGVVLNTLTGVLTGAWTRLVNPVHRVVAGLWIGTLFVLLVAGIASAFRDEDSRARRGAIVADMVNGFSPLALVCGMLVVASGLTTAWRHLNPLSSLWTTPYGYALIVKLLLAAVVFALGAWNWRRVRPTLGGDDAATTIRRSARAELTAAALVLAATAIVVSLPSPRPPRPPGSVPPAGPP
ncbi:copper resistance D domain protein (plasmid) [Gemmatirosa kalamazoonensis]|uniref:Copper resistance D domain protein n=1 Tax=Gemmatirosa kalamazoonensis TaxID=861299 RepID=W0RPI1_9BACT|nr:CopD family protein [Gemmatirosa kalamazoonensis]AHG92914.1 copper resistance D domain protein [Gemmatirosa kalamazoonensis]